MPKPVLAIRPALFAAFLLTISLNANAAPPPVDDFLKSYGVEGIALSPNGAWLAAVQSSEANEDIRVLTVYKVQGTRLALHTGKKFENIRVYDLTWVNNERLLITLQNYDPESRSAVGYSRGGRPVVWHPPQLATVDPGLEDFVLLLKDEPDFKYSLNRSEILHWLPGDPRHVLMAIFDSRGRSWGWNIYKVNVYDGAAERVEKGNYNTVGWGVDESARPRLRIDSGREGERTYFARRSGEEKWLQIAHFRRREIPDILPLAFSSDPDILYVLARHDGDRQSVYEYSLGERKLGRLIFAHPKVDMAGALFANPDRRLTGFRYVVHKPQAHYLEEKLRRLDAKLERSFGAENFATPIGVTRDGRLMLLEVTGPRDPGTYYLYDTVSDSANLIGTQSSKIVPEQMGRMQPIVYKARDGVEINAYFTTPPGNPPSPPLVVLPHGGPEARDYLTWSPMVQFLATRGYAVLQPNFRGSDGFGKKFAESGYKQWGMAMQDDITDGVHHVTKAGLADPERICVVGGSYGGYAALAGAAFTPDLYKCAVSINGVGDLHLKMGEESRRRSEYHYWRKSVGDLRDKADVERMRRFSPALHAGRIRIPVLLFAGKDDITVEVRQSRDMAKALKAAGKPHEYIEFEKEGHTIARYENRKRMLEAIERFLGKHIGRNRPETAASTTAP